MDSRTLEVKDQKRLELTALFLKSLQTSKITTYRPYPWQVEFHEAGQGNPERMLMAANRVGKCCTYATPISTPNGFIPVGELYETGKPFDVLSWNGREVVTARALPPFKKQGLHECYRFETAGGWFECADHHLIFCDGEWQHAERLAQYVSARQVSISEFGQKVHVSSAQSCFERLRDFLAHCFQGFHRGGGQLHAEARNAARDVQRLGGVQRHIFASSYKDDLGNKYTNNVQPFSVRHSNQDGQRRFWGRFFEFLNQAACKFDSQYLSILQAVPQLSTAGVQRRLVEESPFQAHDISTPGMAAFPSPLLTSNDVISCTSIGSQEVYDFTVLDLHNYLAGGMVHHNTVSAACEVSYHLTGDYPSWWQGKWFDKPVLVWTGSPTNETSKDIVQAELVGDLGESLGTGWVPRNRIVGKPTTRQAGVKNVIDSFKVRHKSGGLSTCVLKTYEQGWQKWQGTAPHVVWLDEEPDDYKIFSEAQTRILTSHGIVFVTFTPLSGVTELVDHFMKGGDGIYLRGASWDDAPHLSKEDKDRLAASYRDHERDARTKGIPMMGEGAVFPVSDERIKIDPVAVPDHWARIKGCDFGIDHPAAGVEIAWDRDQDVIYVIDCYRKKDETAAYHAAWFNKSNKLIPVSWPHDGMNREKNGGKTLAQHYRDHGVNMLSKSARYPRAPGEETDKGGPQPVEPIVDEVLERMQTGRFKVFSTLPDWFEEKRSYHRKDGKIVDRRDDILKATFYAVMMKRYAVSMGSVLRGTRSAPPSRPIASSAL